MPRCCWNESTNVHMSSMWDRLPKPDVVKCPVHVLSRIVSNYSMNGFAFTRVSFTRLHKTVSINNFNVP